MTAHRRDDAPPNDSTATGPAVAPGAYVAPGAVLEPDVRVGPNAVVLSGDTAGTTTTVERAATLGANSTVLAGLTIGFEADVRPGSVVTRSVPPRAIAQGNPALIVGYVDAAPVSAGEVVVQPHRVEPGRSRVRDVALMKLRTASDLRGTLAVAEAMTDIPFQPARCFLVFGVPTAETRGEHAHRQCHQLLVAVTGVVRVVADDGNEREEFVLDRPTNGVYLPAMTWGIQYGFSADAVLMVLASEPYDPDDYIRSYAEFLELARAADDPA